MSFVPSEISAGLSLRLPIAVAAYPAPDWSLTLAARGAGTIDLASTADGLDHVLAMDAQSTAVLAAGRYWYQLRATDGTDVVQVEDGVFVVKADLASADADFDGRDHVDRVLDAIEAVIEGRASLDQQSYRINNRELQRTPIADLLSLRSVYRRQKAQRDGERLGRGLIRRRVLVSF